MPESVATFARRMLADDRLLMRPPMDGLRWADGWGEAILYRDGPWQVELVMLLPGVDVPMHRHMRCESCDVALSGSGEIVTERFRGPFGRDESRPLARTVLRIPAGMLHGGKAGPSGCLWLSFQRWAGEPAHISEDWQTW